MNYVDTISGNSAQVLEYLGTCLTSTMESGIEYSVKMSIAASSTVAGFFITPATFGPIEIVIYGSTNCSTWPLNLFSNCPNGYDDWIEIATITYTPDTLWSEITYNFTPVTDINAIAIGGPCIVPPEYNSYAPSGNSPYFFVDNIILNKSSVINNEIIVNGNLCKNDLKLSCNSGINSISSQWYKDGVAIIGNIDTTLHLSILSLTHGTFQYISILEDSTCAISEINLPEQEIFIPNFEINNNVGCSPLITDFYSSLNILIDSCTWIFEGVNFVDSCNGYFEYLSPGTYNVGYKAYLNNGCVFDTIFTDIINVTDCNAIPQIDISNVFTPNGDDLNDFFYLKSKNINYIKLSIFNRWGTLIFEKESNDIINYTPTWDGMIGNEMATDGVYFYTYKAKSLNDQLLNGKGLFHLIIN